MSTSQEIEVMAPDRASLVFSNEFVKVVAVELEPELNLPAYPATDRLIYALSDCKLTLSTDQAENQTHTWKKGQGSWISAGENSITNAGETTAKFLIVNRVTQGLPGLKESDSRHSLAETAPQLAETVFDNETIQITAVNLPAGVASPAYEGVNSLVYSLNLLSLKLGKVTGPGPDSTTHVAYEELTIKPGTAHWYDRGKQILANPGEVAANFLVFSFKQ